MAVRGIFENTFENGLSSDYNVVLQPDGTYRYMKNCQLVSQDGNNFVVKDCLGNVLTFAINAPYLGIYTIVADLPKILAMISFPNKLIVFSTNSLTGGYMEIGKLEYLPYGEGVQPQTKAGQYNAGYIPLYHHISLNGSQQHKIKGFSFIENELIERVYWTDNFNEPRVFNVSDPIFTTYIPSGSLVVGQQYMVLEGAITHGGFNYGPGLTAVALENVFTASGVNYTNLTGTTPTPKVVEYFPYQLMDFMPSRSLGNIIFDRYSSGNLYCGSKVYYYRLGLNSGIVTSWSYGSSPVPVGTINDSVALSSPTVQYHDFVGAGTQNTLVNSNNSVFVNIENIDLTFDYIELACAEFDQLINIPRQISIVNRLNITASTMNIEHNGSINLGTLTIGDITLFPASILKVKTLATNKNYILAGNITEREEFNIDFGQINPANQVTATAIQYPMNVHYDANSCSLSGMVYSGVSPVTGINPAAGSVTPFSRWKVFSGTAIYNGNNYVAGDVITGVTGAGNNSIDVATHPGTQIRPCVTKNRYTTSGGDRVENSIELKGSNPSNTCFWDWKSAAVHHHVASYWSNEIYRFGILFYDKKGNPFYVKWLFDFQFPYMNFKGGLLRKDEIGNTGVFVYSLNPTILSIGNIVIPPDIIAKISGFSIVRAERDARIVTQGLVAQNIDTGVSPKVYRPGAWNPMVGDAHGAADKVYSFICPDTLVGVPLSKVIGVVGDTMEGATWIEPFNYGGGINRGSGKAGSEQVYLKGLTCLSDVATSNMNRSGVITYYDTVNESQTLTNLGSGVTYENKSMLTAPAGVDVIGDCVTAGADYNLNSHNGTGGKKTVFILQDDFLHYGPAVAGYTDPTENAQTNKILMNYVKTGFSNPYGGTGDGAKANTLYISTGHFQPITTQVLSDTFDGTNYVFNGIEIGGGDCFPSLIDYGYALWDISYGANEYSYAWTFPCECNSNYGLRRGRKTSNVEMFYDGTPKTEAIVIGTTIKLEDFSYNQGYSTQGQEVVYPALPVNFINSGQFQARIRFAGEKFSGETIDSFRTFAITDFKDLSFNYGRINDINVKEDKVVVWQDNAISTVPILERQIVGGLNGDATAIGTGGVVDRFDVLSSYFGTQHQWSITETEYGFAWFDMKRKAFVILDFNGGLLEVSQIYGLKAFFDEAFLEIEGNTSTDTSLLVNSPTFEDTSDRPISNVGIISVYDPKFKMTYMCFKFYGQKSTGLLSKDFTIGYLHTNLKKCFVGFFDWFPYHMYNHNGIVLSANNPKNTNQYLPFSAASKSFVVGDTLWGNASTNKQIEYICYVNVTINTAAKFPDGVNGTDFWIPINKVNQLWVSNQPILLNQTVAPGYQYNKFFGRVVDNQIDIIINPKQQGDEAFEVQNISQNGPFNVNYTDIYIDADNQSGADLNITSTNRNYRFIFDKIVFNLMRDALTTARIINKYLRVSLRKKNYTTDPTILTTSVKILRSITSYFATKR